MDKNAIIQLMSVLSPGLAAEIQYLVRIATISNTDTLHITYDPSSCRHPDMRRVIFALASHKIKLQIDDFKHQPYHPPQGCSIKEIPGKPNCFTY